MVALVRSDSIYICDAKDCEIEIVFNSRIVFGVDHPVCEFGMFPDCEWIEVLVCDVPKSRSENRHALFCLATSPCDMVICEPVNVAMLFDSLASG